jgi:hypothetical protein
VDARYRAVVDALARVPPDPDEIVAALGLIPALHRHLDDLERAAIDAARGTGTSWGAIAEALGLRSRQAAEQRRLRLTLDTTARDPGAARSGRSRQQSVDKHAGQPIIEFRRAVQKLVNAIDGTPGWADQAPAAALARTTLRIALGADPGALVDLVRHALDDIDGLPPPEPDHGLVTRSVAVLRKHLPQT